MQMDTKERKMASITQVKKDGKPVAVKIASDVRVGPGMGPRGIGAKPRQARAGLCSAPTAAEKIAACGRV